MFCRSPGGAELYLKSPEARGATANEETAVISKHDINEATNVEVEKCFALIETDRPPSTDQDETP